MFYYSLFSGWWKEMNTDSLKHHLWMPACPMTIWNLLTQWMTAGSISFIVAVQGAKGSSSFGGRLGLALLMPQHLLWWGLFGCPSPQGAKRKQKSRAPNRYRMNSDDRVPKKPHLRRLVTFRQPLDAIATSPWSRTGASVGRVAGPAPGKGQQFHHVFRSIFEKHGAEMDDELDGNLISGYALPISDMSNVNYVNLWLYPLGDDMCVPHRWYRLCARGWG